MLYLEPFTKYADFSGRATRSEYWLFIIINSVILAVLLGLAAAISWWILAVFAVFYLAVLLPSLAVLVRRLHDTGRSGWWILVSFVPFGGIVLLIFTLMGSGWPQLLRPGTRLRAYPNNPEHTVFHSRNAGHQLLLG